MAINNALATLRSSYKAMENNTSKVVIDTKLTGADNDTKERVNSIGLDRGYLTPSEGIYTFGEKAILDQYKSRNGEVYDGLAMLILKDGNTVPFNLPIGVLVRMCSGTPEKPSCTTEEAISDAGTAASTSALLYQRGMSDFDRFCLLAGKRFKITHKKAIITTSDNKARSVTLVLLSEIS